MSDPTEQEITAFVGPNADYYLRKWDGALEAAGTAGNATGFNWAAFLLSGLWLPYRRMYRTTAILLGILLAETLLEEIVYRWILGKPEAPGTLGNFVGLIAALICGGFGNAWYLSHAKERIAEVRARQLPEEGHFHELKRLGGTDLKGALLALLIFLGATVALIMLVEQLM